MTDVSQANPAPQQDAEPHLVLLTDGTGWSGIYASPEWWRQAATSPNWPDLAKQIAQAGEENIDPHLCRVVGATTRRPCKFDTLREPCPHHGADNETNRCGSPTRKGGTCRWNLAVKGPCRNHPETWERLEQTRRDQEQAARQAQEEAAHAAAEHQRQAQTTARAVACPHCEAEPEVSCRSRDGAAKDAVHARRRRFAEHMTVAAATPCPSCEAETGTLCRTSSGKATLDPHAARSRTHR
ncbi:MULTISPECIES: zinc finger domain-containing protein [Streptomycetaceae]|uniref:zinc finger domain-containing protein n=1 Tax=Streptomycetaceae TaxID=2062 RepID=UPI0011611E02|nr:hypothetical protein [Streptomyces sp. CB02056]